MECNVGTTERVIRIAAGIVILLAGLVYRNWWGIVGLAPLITGAIAYCPVSKILGINTCKPREETSK
ncbi:Protein of unknown function (DUF2892) [Acididesulfobacillus acetoxydans]|uniref:Inner membrane protein YgaP-like transmembrane domain-containing protein n=1 Tax=Acididesulfobacillus acetoxydans TaxID=1561005 RepID=A0A8S0WPL5_9FIRM|nr:DUF2892 domain-containing protein [Acididesulfobacillus acetoxydans]CAA7602004.1 Protein of unknown function (DUF2892) [Acididesulfobacillus acetoxydans]CEJ08153.1 Protein of unknown function (DUF2892) [Acididesulfobacillus acetoxydans]